MSTTTKAHTPGPWEIDTSTSSQGHDIYSAGEEELLASVYPMKRDGIFESWKANARLIAAAPDYFAAVDYWMDQIYDGEPLKDWQVALLAAHKKAKGDL